MLINVRDIEEKLKKRPVGTVDWYKFFSVTIPLIETEEGLSMVFEVRAAGLKTQPGDICFPGGRMEEGETALQCALRELKEETGISPSDLRVLGQFDTLHEFSGHTLYTFAVSLAPQALQKARLNQEEVAELFTVPLEFFRENTAEIYDIDVVSDVSDFPYDKTGISPDYKWRKGKNLLPLYRYEDKIIWGITARIVKWFIEQIMT
ncbi:MAG: CoA pyrophosphatase [Firmicutes bacterium]|nr:CoA pyrophosphatase [Bacillota bacterium]